MKVNKKNRHRPAPDITPPKFYNNVFLLVGLTTLGTLVKFDWLIHYVMCPNFSTTNFNLSRGHSFLNSLQVSRDGLYLVDELFVALQQRDGGQLVLPEILRLRYRYTFLKK